MLYCRVKENWMVGLVASQVGQQHEGLGRLATVGGVNKIIMSVLIMAAILLLPLFSFAQNRGNVWCFGDSAGINFNNINNPVPIETGLRTRGSCASICDTSGHLLFYSNDRTNTSGDYTTFVYDSTHSIMPNGDTIVGEDWYNELAIIPFPNNDSLYYLFSASVLGPLGLYYSVINMKANNGLGDVILKNIKLKYFAQVDCLTPVKHGNGRDWWLFFRKWDPNNLIPNNEFYSYLITPAGITNYQIQNIGAMQTTGLGKMQFNQNAERLAYINKRGVLELYNFDRCTGIISQAVNVSNEPPSAPYPNYFFCEFSPLSNLLYVSVETDTSYLLQFDLNAANIAASCDTLWSSNGFPQYCGGALKRGLDNKIYFSNQYYDGINFPYPYADSVYNMYNMNLGVINSPDSLGAACNFQPYSFYLGGKRTYYGLPNNPDYDLGPLTGSICDTLTAIENIQIDKGELLVSYITAWQKAFINAQHLKGNTYTLTVTDIMGRQVFKERGALRPPYFTKDLDCSSFSSGMYIITLTTNKEQVAGKFIKE
ncbi:MAG: T9SS type A sorting domain-containing protein [Bacteroidia bacterium]